MVKYDYWTLVLGPKFSKQDRTAIPLGRAYSLNQVEYCREFIFRRHFPIHQIFERSCELGLFCLTADSVRDIVDMPDPRASRFVRLCLQNHGRLSQTKRALFGELSDDELTRMEAAVLHAIKKPAPRHPE